VITGLSGSSRGATFWAAEIVGANASSVKESKRQERPSPSFDFKVTV
jgi:hypothetical protein